MAHQIKRVTVTDHTYHWITYEVVVMANSRDEVLVKAGAAIGQEKARRERQITGREPGPMDITPAHIQMTPATLDEYYAEGEGKARVTREM